MSKLSFKLKLFIFSVFAIAVPISLFAGLAISILNPSSSQILSLIGIGLTLTLIFSLLSILLFKKIVNSHFKKLFFLIEKTANFLPQQVKILKGDDDVEQIIRLFSSFKQTIGNYTQKQSDLENFIKFEREKLSCILSNISDPVIGIDNNFKIAFFNKPAAEILGIDPDDSLYQPLSQLFKFFIKNKELDIKQLIPLKSPGFSGVLFTGQDIKTVSLLNNKEAFVDMTVCQLQAGIANNLSSILVFHDSTKEKQLEAMKLDFVSMAAHELRTPLTSIKGYISVFIQENEKKLSEDQMMFIRRINTSAQQLSALVENLLGVARVERGAMTITTQPMDWVQNVQTIKEMFEHRAQEKRLDLEFKKPDVPIPTIQADSVRINEVLNNFVANAINYTEPGGKVTIWIEYKNNEVITHVTDSGRGIPKESLAHLFTKFYRVPGNLDQASKGNGLGLYISKAIVDLHKGRTWADSPGLGKGSTFSFSLPVVDSIISDLSVLTKKL